jgi:CheY-like chemotaxis protein
VTNGAVEMLVVEDNPGDVVFLKEAIEASGRRVCMRTVDNGGDALAFLRRQGKFMDAPRPDVVVLDLNIPVKSGKEVLREMAADAALRQIPVMVLSTSESEEQVTQLYPPGRCRYMVKTSDFDRLTGMVGEIQAFAASCAEQRGTDGACDGSDPR